MDRKMAAELVWKCAKWIPVQLWIFSQISNLWKIVQKFAELQRFNCICEDLEKMLKMRLRSLYEMSRQPRTSFRKSQSKRDPDGCTLNYLWISQQGRPIARAEALLGRRRTEGRRALGIQRVQSLVSCAFSDFSSA